MFDYEINKGLVNLMELSKRLHDSSTGFVTPRPPRRAGKAIRSLNEQLNVLCPVRFGRNDLWNIFKRLLVLVVCFICVNLIITIPIMPNAYIGFIFYFYIEIEHEIHTIS